MPKMTKSAKYLLDTHIFLWLMLANKQLKARDTFEAAARTGGLFVSPISCWEISMLTARGRLHLGMPCQDWINKALKAPGLNILSFSPEVAIEASYLPGKFHGDPADQILVAAARTENIVLATRDEKILAYGKQGHLNTLAC
jgi:PIN domain nuclease of toxin-antitoxin system